MTDIIQPRQISVEDMLKSILEDDSVHERIRFGIIEGCNRAKMFIISEDLYARKIKNFKKAIEADRRELYTNLYEIYAHLTPTMSLVVCRQYISALGEMICKLEDETLQDKTKPYYQLGRAMI